ncbi:MAG: hypothetical protein KDA24_06175 [Deltaproteobacteria bacterium]|nr:hypothetical protein [Deltaproteobacteria bacterium]
MRTASLVALSSLLLLTTGCPEDGGIGPFLTNGAEMPERDPDTEWDGNLSDGSIIDIDWASSGAFGCYPGTENVNFTGNHVFVDEAIGEDMGDFHVRVNPSDPTVDVSLYAIKVGTSTTDYPPDLASAIACDTSFDRENNGNPGVSEAATVQAGNAYRIIVGVAGANDQTSGAYDVEVWYGD